MQIGTYTIYPVETGTFALDGGAMFGVIPKNLWQKSNPADDQNRIDLALRALLLKSPAKRILIDCGIGTKFDTKRTHIYKINQDHENLNQSLATLGLKAEDITDVLISHLHFDHVGGITYYHNGHLKLTFPNARYYVQEEQWNWAVNPSFKDRASFLEEDLIPLKQSGQLVFLQNNDLPFPDIEVYRMFGHTPAMQLFRIKDKKTSLFYCADLIPTRSHIPLPWVMAYDNYPLQTLKEKSTILSAAVKNNWLLFFEHDPNFCAGFVVFDPAKGYLPGTSFGKSDFNDL